MPTYQYECRDCSHRFEQYQKFSDDPLTVCPSCGGEVRRVIQNVGVVFKGSGWYINDSRKSSNGGSSDGSTHPAKPQSDEQSSTTAADSTKAKEPAATTESKSTSTKSSSAATS
jgi:putative FmdB family regulatory protein